MNFTVILHFHFISFPRIRKVQDGIMAESEITYKKSFIRFVLHSTKCDFPVIRRHVKSSPSRRFVIDESRKHASSEAEGEIRWWT